MSRTVMRGFSDAYGPDSGHQTFDNRVPFYAGMMLVAATVAIALVASTALAAGVAAPVASDGVPPMTVTVSVGPESVAVAGARGMFAEAAAIWRPGGISFVWQRTPP